MVLRAQGSGQPQHGRHRRNVALQHLVAVSNAGADVAAACAGGSVGRPRDAPGRIVLGRKAVGDRDTLG